MTLEEKAKAYDEALERMKYVVVVPQNERALQALKETIFPELRESEDEKIRKEIINYLDFAESHNLLRAADYEKKKGWLVYLEKQKDAFENGHQLGIMQEQARQELEWTDEKRKEHQNNSDAPKKVLDGALISPLDKDTNLDEIAQDYVDNVKEYNPEPTWDLMQTAVCYGYHYCEQKEQKWTEEDWALLQEMRDYQMSLIGSKPDFSPNKVCDSFIELIDKLMSKRPPQSYWKPSKVQMAFLDTAIKEAEHQKRDKLVKHLQSLYNDLKKLMYYD